MDDLGRSDFDRLSGRGDGEDEPVIVAPPPVIGQDERRMQVRAYNYWASLLGKRRFPAPERLLAGEMPEFSGNAVLLHFEDGLDDPSVLALGEALAAECGGDGAIRRLSHVPGRSVLSRITDHYLQIIANEAPIGFEAEFVNLRGATVLYRGILLPFSTDDATIDYIYGVINWKELADQRTTDSLMHEIAEALHAPAPAADRGAAADLDDWAGEAGQWSDGGWADGPAASGDAHALDLAPFLPAAPGKAAPRTLADWLEKARASALVAIASEDRTRQSLYAAIGRAWDFALAADVAPEDYGRLVAEAGLTVQDRAPLVPLVKLVFGVGYDKTRVTEYATVLAHARRIALDAGELAPFLAAHEGGLKAIVAKERAARRAEAERPARRGWADAARDLPTRPLADLPHDGAEFSLVMVRRAGDGHLAMLGEISDDADLLARAARRLAG